MEHFPVVRSLCQSAIAAPSPGVRRQVERLRDELMQSGETKQAAALNELLNPTEPEGEARPGIALRPRANMAEKALTPFTPLPVDRETSAPLADLQFPEEFELGPPLFDVRTRDAVERTLEEWENLEELLSARIMPPMSCLIHGASGSGKTRLGHWLSRELGLPVVSARFDGLVSSSLGSTARNIGTLFGFTNRYRCILQLDELDAIARVRDDPQEVGEIKRVVSALLQNLDARSRLGLTIGITNQGQLLDPAVVRRFDVQIEIPKPDLRLRAAIARHFLDPVEVPESHVRLIAWVTHGQTGAEVELLVREYRKVLTLRRTELGSMVDMLQTFTGRNSVRVDSGRSGLLAAEPRHLYHALRQDPELGFTVAEIGEVAGKDKSTVSRALSKLEAPDGKPGNQ